MHTALITNRLAKDTVLMLSRQHSVSQRVLWCLTGSSTAFTAELAGTYVAWYYYNTRL